MMKRIVVKNSLTAKRLLYRYNLDLFGNFVVRKRFDLKVLRRILVNFEMKVKRYYMYPVKRAFIRTYRRKKRWWPARWQPKTGLVVRRRRRRRVICWWSKTQLLRLRSRIRQKIKKKDRGISGWRPRKEGSTAGWRRGRPTRKEPGIGSRKGGPKRRKAVPRVKKIRGRLGKRVPGIGWKGGWLKKRELVLGRRKKTVPRKSILGRRGQLKKKKLGVGERKGLRKPGLGRNERGLKKKKLGVEERKGLKRPGRGRNERQPRKKRRSDEKKRVSPQTLPKLGLGWKRAVGLRKKELGIGRMKRVGKPPKKERGKRQRKRRARPPKKRIYFVFLPDNRTRNPIPRKHQRLQRALPLINSGKKSSALKNVFFSTLFRYYTLRNRARTLNRLEASWMRAHIQRLKFFLPKVIGRLRSNYLVRRKIKTKRLLVWSSGLFDKVELIKNQHYLCFSTLSRTRRYLRRVELIRRPDPTFLGLEGCFLNIVFRTNLFFTTRQAYTFIKLGAFSVNDAVLTKPHRILAVFDRFRVNFRFFPAIWYGFIERVAARCILVNIPNYIDYDYKLMSFLIWRLPTRKERNFVYYFPFMRTARRNVEVYPNQRNEFLTRYDLQDVAFAYQRRRRRRKRSY